MAIEDRPIPAVHGVVRWPVIDPCQWLWDGYAGGWEVAGDIGRSCRLVWLQQPCPGPSGPSKQPHGQRHDLTARGYPSLWNEGQKATRPSALSAFDQPPTAT